MMRSGDCMKCLRDGMKKCGWKTKKIKRGDILGKVVGPLKRGGVL